MKKQYYEKYKKIGLKISYYRKCNGITQEQLAEKNQQRCLVYRGGGSSERQQSCFA